MSEKRMTLGEMNRKGGPADPGSPEDRERLVMVSAEKP